MAILTAMSLPGCWWQISAGPGGARFNGLEDKLTRDNVESLSEEWSVDMESPLTEPIATESRIYGTSVKLSDDLEVTDTLAVRAFDVESGDLTWERPLLPEDVSVYGQAAPVVFVDGAVWVAHWHEDMPTCEGRLTRLDPETGDILTSEATERIASPIVAEGSVISYTTTGECGPVELVTRDRETLETLWSFGFPSGSSYAKPIISDGKIFIIPGNALYAFSVDGCGDATCDPLWVEYDEGDLIGFREPVAGPDGQIYVNHTGSSVHAVDGDTGTLLWETSPIGDARAPVAGMAVAYGTLYVGWPTASFGFGVMGTLNAYSADGCGEATCAPSWSVPIGEDNPPWAVDRLSAKPAVAGGVVYLGLITGSGGEPPAVAAIDAHGCGNETCDELLRVPVDQGDGGVFPMGGGAGPLSVANGRVLTVVYTGSEPTPYKLTSLAPTALP